MATHTLADLRRVAAELWPESIAESWDRVGLVTGRGDAPLERILFAVDAVSTTVDEAAAWGANALVTHHPLLLRGVHTIAEDTAKGSLLAKLLRTDCALLAAHTNADQPVDGVSDVIAKRLGLEGTRPLVPIEGESAVGIGRIGSFAQAIRLSDVAERLAALLPQTVSGVRVAGDPDRSIRTIALLGGAGDSLLSHPSVLGADLYITSDLRHHPAQEALEHVRVAGGPALIDVAHWASESLWLEVAAQQVAERLPGIETRVSRRRTDPWDFSVGAAVTA